jgi:drug/metabolite transporter (DMT)-like permease
MPERKNHLDALAISLLVACCLFWGFQQILIKTTVGEVPPLWQASLRMLGATALLWLVRAARREAVRARRHAARRAAGRRIVCRRVLLHLPGADEHHGLAAHGVSVHIAVCGGAAAAALCAVRTHAAGAMGRAGDCLCRAWRWPSAKASCTAPPAASCKGDALALAAGTLWGLTTLVIRASAMMAHQRRENAVLPGGRDHAGGALLSLALGETWGLAYSTQAWVSIGLQTAVGAFASYLTWMWLLRHYPATQMSSFTFLTPLFALVLGVLLLGEPLTLQLVLALVGVAVGIVLVNRKAG